MECPLIELRKVSKFFPGVIALNKADLKLYSGEVHGLMGENGAGKSTLIKLLTGAYKPDEGEMLLDGQPLKVNGPKDAMNMGLTAIYQELNVIPKLTVWENIFLGRELRNKKGLLDIPQMKERAKELLQQLRQNIDVDEKVENLGMGHQQMVEICKALVLESRLIIMDEPTSSISDKEVAFLFKTMRSLTSKGVGIIYISHKMSELEEICDRVTVMRDGEYVGTEVVKNTTKDALVAMMVGRELTNYYTRDFEEHEEVIMRCEGISDGELAENVSFELRKGEILGFAGLVGAGRSEVMKSIFGLMPKSTGDIYLEGKKVTINSPIDAMKNGIALVPENRKLEGLYLVQSVRFNSTIEVLNEFIKGIFVDNSKEREITQEYIDKMATKTPSQEQAIGNLSGGNQQKAIIAREVESNSDLLIAVQPTRGLDVGAIEFIHKQLVKQRDDNKAVLLVSLELDEVMNVSDRILVMYEGEIVANLDPKQIDEKELGLYMSGSKRGEGYEK